MIVTGALALPDKIRSGVRQEQQRMLRLNIFIGLLLKKCFNKIARGSLILIHFQMILITVQHAHENCFGIRIPGDGCQILFGISGGLQKLSAFASDIIDTQGHMV